jgi:hypothetical protein
MAVIEQHKVAHHHHAAVRRFERRPAAECERRPYGDAIDGHLQIAAREAVAMDVAGDGTAASDCGIDLLPIDLLSVGSGGACHRGADRQ